MTAILFDGFDMVDYAHRWTNAGSSGVATSPVRSGTHSYLMSSNGNLNLALQASEEDDVMYCGFGWYSNTGIDQLVVATFSENFGTIPHVCLIRKGLIRGWEVRLTGAVGGTLLIPSIPNVWFPNSWHYIEFAAKIHATTGWVELRQDGVRIGRFDGDTDNAGSDQKIDHVDFNMDNNAGEYYLDDVYILNEQGSVNNSWLGDTRCFPLYPNGNGGSSTPLSGSDGNTTDNYLLVDEAGTPDSTDYVFSSTNGDQDTYTFQDLSVTLGTIRGVEVRMHAAKDDTGTKQLRSVTRRSATDSFGADKVLAAVPLYQTHTEMQELDPHAGPGAWTITNVNGTEWGIEVRA